MIPELPEDLSTLSDDELAALVEEFTTAFNEASEGARTAEDVEALAAVADGIDVLRTEQATRAEAESAVADRVAELTARVNASDTPAEPEEEEPEAPAEEPAEAPQAIAASSVRRTRPTLEAMAARRPAAQAPVARAESRIRVLAAPDLPGHSMGSELSIADVAEAIIDRHARLGRATTADGETVPIATVEATLPAERHMRTAATPGQNAALVASVLEAMEAAGPQSLVAAGGLCAPVAPLYDMPVFSSAARPIRDGLPSFGADRGGVTLIAPPTLANLTASVTVVTAAQDLAGGAGSTKDCLHVTCGAARTFNTQAIARCVEFGNFGARAFPEQVEAWLAYAAAAHARRAETALLDAFATNSIAVTAAQVLGAARELIARAAQARAGYISRNRMDEDSILDGWFPSWIPDLIRADAARGQEDIEVIPTTEIEGWFRAVGIRPNWYLDGKTGGAQVFGAQAAGALLTFPTTAIWYLFAPGTFLFLDSGTLDFGLVRDSTLNTRNDYRIMVETFEALAYTGIESLEVTHTLCASGEMGGRRTGGAALVCPV